jgi:hypothetical protein
MGVIGGAALAVVALASAAFAGGGGTIAAAPTIVFGQQQMNTLNGIDFWRIPLKEGDRLTLRFGPQKSYSWLEVCLLAPDVTDSTVGNQACYAHQSALGDSKLTLDARPGGNWTLAVLPYPGCESEGVLNLRCNAGVSYYATAFVKHPTRLTLRAPSISRTGGALDLSGTLTGSHGAVLIEQSWNGGTWHSVAIAHPSSSGTFRVRLKPARKGSLRVRATFPEAPSYVGSSAAVFVRVV